VDRTGAAVQLGTCSTESLTKQASLEPTSKSCQRVSSNHRVWQRVPGGRSGAGKCTAGEIRPVEGHRQLRNCRRMQTTPTVAYRYCDVTAEAGT